MKVKTTEGVKDVSLLEVNAHNYICPENERHLYHCIIEVRKFDSESGQRLSKPRLQKFDRKFFDTFGLHCLKQQGYTIIVLHDPIEWEQKHAQEIKAKAEAEAKAKAEEKAKAEAEAKAKAEEKAKAEAEAKAKEREELKAELRAELMAEMQEKAETKKPGRKPKETE